MSHRGRPPELLFRYFAFPWVVGSVGPLAPHKPKSSFPALSHNFAPAISDIVLNAISNLFFLGKPQTLIFLSLLFWKKQGKPPRKARIFLSSESLKSLRKKGKTPKKTRKCLATKKARKSKKARKGRSGNVGAGACGIWGHREEAQMPLHETIRLAEARVVRHAPRGSMLSSALKHSKIQQTRVYLHPLGAGSARPNPKMGAPDPENPLFLGFSVLRGGLRPWSQTMGPDHGVGADPETVKNTE